MCFSSTRAVTPIIGVHEHRQQRQHPWRNAELGRAKEFLETGIPRRTCEAVILNLTALGVTQEALWPDKSTLGLPYIYFFKKLYTHGEEEEERQVEREREAREWETYPYHCVIQADHTLTLPIDGSQGPSMYKALDSYMTLSLNRRRSMCA